MSIDNKTSAFDGKQYADAYPDGVTDHYWHLARTNIIASTLTDYASAESIILEVGCGRGFVVRSLRSSGFNINGVELADVNVTHEAKPFVDAATDATDLPASYRESVSTILLLDVIEHISDPVTFLNNIKISYPNLDNVVITVPARQEIWSNFDDYFGHHRRYDIKSSKALVDKLGAELVTTRYFFHVLYLFALPMKFLPFDREVQITAPSGFFSRLINRVIANILKLEYKLSFRNLPGSSLLLVFKWEN